MTRFPDYSLRRARAGEWTQLAEHCLRFHTWIPTEAERAVAFDISRGLRCPSTTLPPHTDEPTWRRLDRLGNWAPMVRLALRASGLSVPFEEIDAADPTVALTLMDLLKAVYTLSEVTEQWRDCYTGAETPEFLDQLADAERFFSGFGSVGELFAAVASGNVD